MPTDFFAKWISFLGQNAFKAARFQEPASAEERDYYRMVLGLISLASMLFVLAVFLFATPSMPKALLLFLSGTKPDNLVGHVFGISFVLIMLMVIIPPLVGAVYELKHRSPKVFSSVIALGFVVLAVTYFPFPVFTGIFSFLVVILMMISMAPSLPPQRVPDESDN